MSFLSVGFWTKAHAAEADQEERARAQRAEVVALAKEMETIGDDQSVQSIRKLARILGRTGLPSALQVEEKWPVHRLAQERISKIPGFIPYWLEELKKARENDQAERERKPLPHEGLSFDYEGTRYLVINTLCYLPTVESVRTLGDFLSDWEWPGYEGDPREKLAIAGEMRPNCILAAKALGKLIDDRPLEGTWLNYHFDEVEIWQSWYRQVKAGRHTFRFIGDPKTYRFPPLVEIAEPSVDELSLQDEAGPATVAPVASRAFLWPIVIGTCCLLIGLGWLLKRRNGRQA